MDYDPYRWTEQEDSLKVANELADCGVWRRRTPIKMERLRMALTAHGGQTDRRRRRRHDAGEAASGRLSTRLQTHMVVRKSVGVAGSTG